MLVDVHAHLTLPDFAIDLPDVLARARDMTIICNGLDAASNAQTHALAQHHPNVLAAFGMYPTTMVALSEDAFAAELQSLEKNREQFIALGEVGMDFQEDSQHTLQEERFAQLVALARKLHKPLIVHSRKAEQAVVDLLAAQDYKKIILHCFCGSMKLVRRAADAGWFLSIPPIVVRTQHFQLVAERVDLSQLLTESDCPYLSPYVGQRNEPSFVAESVKKIAAIKKISVDDVARALADNFKKLFPES